MSYRYFSLRLPRRPLWFPQSLSSRTYSRSTSTRDAQSSKRDENKWSNQIRMNWKDWTKVAAWGGLVSIPFRFSLLKYAEYSRLSLDPSSMICVFQCGFQIGTKDSNDVRTSLNAIPESAIPSKGEIYFQFLATILSHARLLSTASGSLLHQVGNLVVIHSSSESMELGKQAWLDLP